MSTADRSLDPATEREIDRFLDDHLIEYEAPGASLAVFDSDGVLYASGYGLATLDPVERATPDSLLHVASVTKSLTATAVMQLVERGELALDDPVSDHVDFFESVPGDPVTVEELVTHSSGIPSEAGRQGGWIADREELVRRFDRWAGERLADRERVMYYNGGYVVLGALVSAVAGRPYADYVDGEILAPLGMDRSTFDDDVLESDDDAMTGYVPVDGDRDLEPATLDPAEFVALREELFGVGGLISTATDLAAVLRCTMNGGALDGARVLESATVEAMCSPQSPPWPTVEGYHVHFGYGWIVEDLLGDRLVSGGGSVPGYSAFGGYLEDRGLGVTLGFNRGDVPKNEIGKGILAILGGQSPAEAVRWYAGKRAVEAVAGTYESERGGVRATVSPGGSGDSLALRTNVEVNVEEWDLQFRAHLEEDRSDGYVFASEMGDGHRWIVEFVETGEGTDLLWSRGPRTIRFSGR